MKINQKWTYPILFLALLAMVVMGNLTPTPDNPYLGSIAAKVDGLEISKAEFIQKHNMIKQQDERQGRKAQHVPFRALRALIQNRAWFITAKENGALASQEEYTLALSRGNPGFSQDMFRRWLDQQGYTESQFVELMESEISGRKLDEYVYKLAFLPSYEKKVNHLLKETKIELAYLKVNREDESFARSISPNSVESFLKTDSAKSQVEGFYKANLKDYKQDKSVRVSNILVAFGKNSKNKLSKEEARKKAESLLSKARSHSGDQKFFRKLVVQETDEPNAKVRKGDLGYLNAKSTSAPQTLIQAAVALSKPGQLSSIVESEHGFHILMATGFKQARNISLKDAQSSIAKKLLKKERRKISNEVSEKIFVALKKNEDVSSLLKKHNLKWEKYMMPLKAQYYYQPKVPTEEFQRVGLSLTSEKPLAQEMIRQKTANYIVKFVNKQKPSSELSENNAYQLQDEKLRQLVFKYKKHVFENEFAIDGAFRGESNKKRNIQINLKYLKLTEST